MNPFLPSNRRRFLAVGTAAVAGLGLDSTKANAETHKIKVGVIGCGSVSTKYLPHLAECPFAELVSTCDIIPERAVAAATPLPASASAAPTVAA